jgi:8-amino-7-oxononanoate synthase
MPDLSLRLDELARAGLARRRRVVESSDGPHLTVEGRRYLAFCSNDYLGLAHDPRLIEAACRGAERYGVGAGASALISGHTSAHDALESRLARFVGLPRALHFGAGYLANLGLVAALAGRGGTVFSDELNHACLIDGARLSRAEVRVYPHMDLAALGRMLERCETPEKLVATDAVFSMDGDLAPLPELLALCERHDAWLVVDDAHGFGVLGKGGRGALAHFGIASPRIAYMGTLGKAAGVHGAFVAGEEALIEWLVQRARSYIFTTASPPLLACALMASLELMEKEEARRVHLRVLIGRLKQKLEDLPWRLRASDTPIQPLIVGDNRAALDLAEGLRSRGIWVPAIRPPTVPQGTARLRIALSAAHGVEHVDELAGALRELSRSA